LRGRGTKIKTNVILHTRYVCACVRAGGGRGRGTKIKTNVILHTCYVSTFVGAGGGRSRGTKIKTKANCCGACYLTCDMYKSSLRHIRDPVLSSLKMKGICFFFKPNWGPRAEKLGKQCYTPVSTVSYAVRLNVIRTAV
jgi:hypothetical protein